MQKHNGTVEPLYGGRFRLVTWQAYGKWNVMVVDKSDNTALMETSDTESSVVAEGRRWAMQKVNRRSLGEPVRMSVFRRLR
jgi:hypothetical protein